MILTREEDKFLEKILNNYKAQFVFKFEDTYLYEFKKRQKKDEKFRNKIKRNRTTCKSTEKA